jgi:HEAT repeat protein
LGKIGDGRALEPLVKACLNNSGEFFKRDIALALLRIDSKLAMKLLISELMNPDPMIRKRAADILGLMRSRKAVGSLIQILIDAEPFVRHSAVVALGRIKDPRAVIPLQNSLQSFKDEVLREKIIWALGEIGQKRSIHILTDFLDDPSDRLKSRAIEALGKTKAAYDIKPLLSILSKKPSLKTKLNIIKTIAKTQDECKDSRLIEMLNDKDWPVRYEAAKGLAELKKEIAIEPLVGCLKDSNWQVRARAAESLGKLGNPMAIAPLVALADDRDTLVRAKVKEAIVLLYDPVLSEYLFDINEKGSRELREYGESIVRKVVNSDNDYK